MNARPLHSAPFHEMPEEQLEVIVEAGAAHPKAWIAWARAAESRSDWSIALARWGRFRSTHPSAATRLVHLSRARALYSLGRIDEAEEELERLVESGDESRPALMAWARSALHRNEHSRALARIDHAIERLGPESHEALCPLRLSAAVQLSDGPRRYDEICRSLELLGYPDPANLPDVPHGDASVAFALAAALVGGDLSAALIERFRIVRERHDTDIAVQHVRNVVYACSWSQAPRGFEASLVDASVPTIRRLRFVNEMFDSALLAVDPAAQMRVGRQVAGRILLVVSYLPRNETGPHMRLVNSFAACFAQMPGTQAVGILVTEELSPEGPRVRDRSPDEGSEQPSGSPDDVVGYWSKDMASLSGDAAARIVLIVPERAGPVAPQQAAYALAVDFRPDLLVTIEGIYRSPVVGDWLARRLPTIAIQSSVGNPEPPNVDIVLSHGHPDDFLGQPTPDKWRRHRIPVVAFPKLERIEEAAVGRPGEIRIATAIGGGRLEQRLTQDDGVLAARIADFLGRAKDAAWILIGVGNEEAIAELFAPHSPDRFKGRLRILGFVPDLRAVYEHCSIYFHPSELVGGGMGIAMAIDEGLPVAAALDCDAANFLPRGWLHRSDADGFDLLARLYRNPALRDRLADVQRRFVADHHSIEAVSASLARVVPAARARFTARSVR